MRQISTIKEAGEYYAYSEMFWLENPAKSRQYGDFENDNFKNQDEKDKIETKQKGYIICKENQRIVVFNGNFKKPVAAGILFQNPPATYIPLVASIHTFVEMTDDG
jgi:hypothetical protein